MPKTYTEKQLNEKVAVVEVPVSGRYIAMIDDKRKTVRDYKIMLQLPKDWDKTDVKNMTPLALSKSNDYEDFFALKTHYEDKDGQLPTDKKMKRKEFMTERMLRKNARAMERLRKAEASEMRERASLGDTSEYDPRTGLPYVVNE